MITLLEFHNFNTELSMALYPAISYFEIVLRNKIDIVFEKYFGEDWIVNGTLPFDSKAIRRIEQAKNQLKQANKPIEHDFLISELSFGFWTGLFMPSYNASIWQKHPTLLNEIFNKKKKVYLHEKKKNLNLIRNYRNKICHYSSIIHSDLKITPNQIHQLIYSKIRGLDAVSVLEELKKIDIFQRVYNKGIENNIIQLKNIEVSLITDNSHIISNKFNLI